KAAGPECETAVMQTSCADRVQGVRDALTAPCRLPIEIPNSQASYLTQRPVRHPRSPYDVLAIKTRRLQPPTGTEAVHPVVAQNKVTVFRHPTHGEGIVGQGRDVRFV